MPENTPAAAAEVEDRLQILDGGAALADEAPNEVGLGTPCAQEERGVRVSRADLCAQTSGRYR